MGPKKKYTALIVFSFSLSIANAQYEIRPEAGYTPQIGAMVDMLEDLRYRIIELTEDLDQTETDYLFDDNANSIGAILMHVVANESYYQVQTLEERSWTEKEEEFWGVAGGLGEKSRDALRGKPIKYYLDIWEGVRKKTLEGLKTKDDEWFAANIEEGFNNHWVWYHVLEHSANHMGQIALVKNRLPN